MNHPKSMFQLSGVHLYPKYPLLKSMKALLKGHWGPGWALGLGFRV